MPQTPRTILPALAALLVVATAITGALLVASPALAQVANTTDATNTTTTATIGDETAPRVETTIETDGTASITFEDQESVDGTSVLVESATVPEGGFVVLAESPLSGNDSYESIRGVSYALNPGTSGDIRIQLDRPINQSGPTQLVATIHRDSNDNGAFEYDSSQGQQDGPYTNENGQILALSTVTVQQGRETTSETPETTDNTGVASETATETTTETTAEPTATTERSTTANDGGDGNGGSNFPGPGFGVGVAVLALLAAALIATRRD